MSNENKELTKSLGTWDVFVAGVSLVVAASTLVSDFNGYFTLGIYYAGAILLGFLINLFLGLSAADLSVAYPKAGALYDYAKAIFKGSAGRFLGIFLGLSFFGLIALAGSGEVLSGAYGLQALCNGIGRVEYYVVGLFVLAIIPNIFSIKTTAWVSAVLLILMLSIRWFFGLAGFFGWGDLPGWSWENLTIIDGGISLFGQTGILTAGLALGIWTYVGIEFAGSLAEETKKPKKSMPRGIIFGLLAIMVTSLIMGIGVTGAASLSFWQEAMMLPQGNDGSSPQLAVGYLFFGNFGCLLMALASFTATLGSATIIFAAVPRMLYSIARNGNFFGPLSRPFGKLHPKFQTPFNATLLVGVVYLITALISDRVVEWIFSGAYAWLVMYAVFQLLAILNRRLHPQSEKAFTGRWFVPAMYAGLLLTIGGVYVAFKDAHLFYGGRALIVFTVALAATTVSWYLKERKKTAVLSTTNKKLATVKNN